MAKSVPQLDVLVLGQHPSAYLATDMLAARGIAVAPDRLIVINPQLFALHKPVEKLRKKLKLTALWGTQFLADDPSTRGQWHSKSPAALVGSYLDLRKALAAQAKESGAKCMTPKVLVVRRVEEKGFDVGIDNQTIHPKAILLAGEVSGENAKVLGLPEAFASEVMRRYTFLRLRGAKWAQLDPKPMLSMSLDIGGKLTWAWLLPGEDEVQLAVEQPLDEVARVSPASLMLRWAQTLKGHGVLKTDSVPLAELQSMDIPAAGALTREIVANRTLLFGPAAGFYTACMEDVYPNCWSAVFAVEAIAAALAQPHLQDALQPYRQQWGTTLGEYLRGPQQNLRFLLPLVYRNPVMTSRMAESILQGNSVVR